MKTKLICASTLAAVAAFLGGCATNIAITDPCPILNPPPTDFSQCTQSKPILWLDASCGSNNNNFVLIGNRVQVWRDKSNFKNDFVQNVPLHQPEFHCKDPVTTKSLVRFDGTNTWLSYYLDTRPHVSGIESPGLATHTIVAYIRPNSPVPKLNNPSYAYPRFNAPATIVGCQTHSTSSGFGLVYAPDIKNSSGTMIQQVSPCYVWDDELNYLPSEPHKIINLTPNQPIPPFNLYSKHMIAVAESPDQTVGAKAFLYLDGGLGNTFHLPANSTGDLNFERGKGHTSRQISCIGGGMGILTDYDHPNFTVAKDLFCGDIYEILVFPDQLSQCEIWNLYNYLTNKW
jgi:hypothetical protein